MVTLNIEEDVYQSILYLIDGYGDILKNLSLLPLPISLKRKFKKESFLNSTSELKNKLENGVVKNVK